MTVYQQVCLVSRVACWLREGFIVVFDSGLRGLRRVYGVRRGLNDVVEVRLLNGWVRLTSPQDVSALGKEFIC